MEILKKYWKFILAYGLLLITLILLLYFYREVYEFIREMIRFFSSRRRLNAYVASYGSFAPFIFICMQCLQVLFAPIPGELTGFIGGFLFGIVPGVIYSTIGLTLGSFLAFLIARRFGMPFIRKFVGQEFMAKFDYLMEHKGAFFSFLFLLISAAVVSVSLLTTRALTPSLFAMGPSESFRRTIFARFDQPCSSRKLCRSFSRCS